MAGNTTTKKAFNNIREDVVETARPAKNVNYANRPGVYDGQLSGTQGRFAEPMNMGAPAKIGGGIAGLHNDIGEMSGFITDGYLDKGNTPYGENAKFNFMPPGMDISNQEMAEIHEMPLRKLTAESYPGDGWMPTPRDIKE
jgi:hypothetical protein